jgi:hypothetical protein
MSAPGPGPLDDAWQAALAAEHQALFGYGVLGPHLSGSDAQLAYACVAAHETLRNATTAAIGAVGLTPVTSLADYPSLYPVTGDPSARRLAIRLEDECAAAWRFLYLQAALQVSARATVLRRRAQAGLTDSAVRAARWRVLVEPARAATPFPGL